MGERRGVTCESGADGGIEEDLSKNNSVCRDLAKYGRRLAVCGEMWSTYTLVVDNLNDSSEVTRVAAVGQEDYTTDFDESEFSQKQLSAFQLSCTKKNPNPPNSPFRKTSRISTYRHCEVCT